MSVSRIPFDARQARLFRQAGFWMMGRVVLVFLLSALATLASTLGIIIVIRENGPPSIRFLLLVASLCGAAFSFFGQGAVLLGARRQLRAVIETDGQDQALIVAGFSQLRRYFLIQIVLSASVLLGWAVFVVPWSI